MNVWLSVMATLNLVSGVFGPPSLGLCHVTILLLVSVFVYLDVKHTSVS